MSAISRSRTLVLIPLLLALLVLAACQQTRPSNAGAVQGVNSAAEATAVASSPLVGTWELVALGTNAAPRPVIDNTHPTAVFNADKSLSGWGGCNDYNTSFLVAGADGVKVFPVAIGRNICSRDITEQESLFVDTLNQAQTFRKDGNRLIILSAGQNSLVLEPR